MAAVILSATVFGEQYLKHPMILLAFIWRIHRHTTGMSHKHVEAFQRPGGGGMEGGRWKRRGQQRLLGSILHIIVIWSFPRKKEEGCEVFFFTLFWPSCVVVEHKTALCRTVDTLENALLPFGYLNSRCALVATPEPTQSVTCERENLEAKAQKRKIARRESVKEG